MMTAVERAATRKQEMYSNQQQKADFLQSLMGKGILMLSLSMIKYRSVQFSTMPPIPIYKYICTI